MNKVKPTTYSSASSNKPNLQNRSSNSSITQNSPVAPKSIDRLSKPTGSNFINNNVVDMSQKGYTGNSNSGRPGSANSQKGTTKNSPIPSYGTTYTAALAQQQKRATTPTQNKNVTSGLSGTAGPNLVPSPLPRMMTSQSQYSTMVRLSSPPNKQQPLGPQPPNPSIQPQKPIIALNPASQSQQPQKQVPTNTPHNTFDANLTGQRTPAHVSATASTSSIRSNSSSRPKSTGVSNSQQQKPVTGQNNQPTNNAGYKPPDAKPGVTINATVTPKPSTKTFPSPVSHARYPSNISRSMVSLERSRNFRAFIDKAMNEHKIFNCCGVYPAVRNALKKRGWVEKPGPLAYSRSANTTLSQITRGSEDESDVAWMTRVLKDYPPDFIWVIRRDNIDWKSLTKDQMINRFPKAWFTTKVGLAACLQHMHWFSEAGVADTFFPRCYRLCLEEERQAFQDDYRLTACMSYLRYFVDTFEAKGHTALADVHSKITPLSVDFASRQLGNYIRMRRHEDIDWLLPPNFMTQHWDAFIHQYYAVVHERKRLRFDSAEAVHVKYETAKKTLQKVAQYWPQIQLDGVYNMWICKPGARSRGKGIVIMNTLEKIMDLLSQSNFREFNWVVQKYIEKPMLIYKTKYDIRQWFLITDWTPLTVWFYKESYVRFCTKPFVLEDFHESIHLCNNAIQCRYQNSEQRDSNLPDENMWSSDTFQAYLKTIGRLDAWPQIYSGMKQAIVGVLLASQETVESKKGCYELYGADFMLTEDFRPWLIEINSCPCMAASTSVTARMCSQCLEDTVKVVIDRRNNRNADTGMFEMIYRQNAGSVVVQQFSGHDLTIVGKKLTRDIDWPMTMSKSVTNTNPKKASQSASHVLPQSQSSNKDNLTFSDLLQKLRVRNQQMFQGALASQQAQTEAIVEGASSANADTTGALLNKMRSLRAQSQDQDIISGMKKVYPTADPKQSPKRVSPTPTLPGHSIEKETMVLPDSAKRPSTPGKGEDPLLAAKFADVNSLAYLMNNTHNTSTTIGDTIRYSKEAAQDAINKTLKQEVKRPSPAEDPAYLARQQVPKTLEEVKAMVEATARQNSEKYGKIQKENEIPLFTNLNYRDNKLADESVCPGAITTITASSPLHHSDEEPPIDDFEGASSRITRSKDSITLLTSKSAHNTLLNSENKEEELEEHDNSETIRRTKSLCFSPSTSLRTWTSERHIDVLKKVSERSISVTESHPYMIYPLPAHPSHEEIPCKENESEKNLFSSQLIPNLTEENEESVDEQRNVISETKSEEMMCVEKEATTITNNENNNQLNVDENDESGQIANLLLDELPLIDLTCTESAVEAQLSRARESRSRLAEADDPNGKLYQSILTSSTSESDSDVNDDNNNEINLATHFIPSTYPFRRTESVTLASDENVRQGSKAKAHNSRLHHRRNTIPSSRRCSRRHPCYRVILEPQNCQRSGKRKLAPTLPLKTVNLLLPTNCNFY